MISCKSLNTLLTDFQLPSEILFKILKFARSTQYCIHSFQENCFVENIGSYMLMDSGYRKVLFFCNSLCFPDLSMINAKLAVGTSGYDVLMFPGAYALIYP